MNKAEVETAVFRAVREVLDLADSVKVTGDVSLEDLASGADSLDFVEVVMDVEHELGVDVDDDDIDHLSARSALNELVAAIAAGARPA